MGHPEVNSLPAQQVSPALVKGEHVSPKIRQDTEKGVIATPSADDQLATLGYQSELTRSRSTWHVAFMAFVIGAVPYGVSTSLFFPLIGGGPVSMIWGWVGVCLIVFCVAVSLGEITSVYPTSGGVYYQTYMLSPPWCRKITSWICGWAYVLGNVCSTTSANFGNTLFLIGCINIFTDGDGNSIWEPTTYQTFLVFVAITLCVNAVSATCNKWLPMLDTFAIFWTFAATIATGICVLAIAREGRHNISYALGDFTASSGWTPGWSFFIGTLHAAYATSATGMVISMCEETREPATQVPRAMVGCVALNGICGVLFIVPLCFVLPDISYLITVSQPVPAILRSAIGNEGGAFALCIPIIVLGLICSVGCTTASSRCTWAFSRDGAIPGSQWWRKVNTRLDVPLNAMLMIMVVELLEGLIYFGSTAAFNGFIGAGVIFLAISYLMPIIVSLIDRRQKLAAGVWNFGWIGRLCNYVSIAWTLFVTPLFCMPSYLPVPADGMNYASVVFVGGVSVSAIWYFLWGRRNYQGPPVQEEEVVRRRQSLMSHVE